MKKNILGEWLGMAGYMGGDAYGFFGNMFREVEQSKKNKRNAAAGIVQAGNGLYGVPNTDIEPIFDRLNFDGKFYHGSADGKNHVFNREYKLLFVTDKFEYLGKDIFLVKKEDAGYGALYKDGVKLTGDHFRTHMGSNFEKSDMCVLGYKEYSQECVININGEIVFENKGYDSIYLHNNIVSVGDKYYNVATGQLICKRNYGSVLEPRDKELMFMMVDGQIWKINTITCEVEKFGTPPEPKPEPVAKVITPAKPKEPVLPKQNRNDLCRCGSGKKFKKCCDGQRN